jgi:hypothetical protein
MRATVLRRLYYTPPTGSALGWCRMRCTRSRGLDVVLFEVGVTFPSESSGVLLKTRRVEHRNVTNRGGSRPAARNWRQRWAMHYPPTPSKGLILVEIPGGQMNISYVFLSNAFYWSIIIWFVHPTIVSDITWTGSIILSWCPRRPPKLPVWMGRHSFTNVDFRREEIKFSVSASNSKIKASCVFWTVSIKIVLRWQWWNWNGVCPWLENFITKTAWIFRWDTSVVFNKQYIIAQSNTAFY